MPPAWTGHFARSSSQTRERMSRTCPSPGDTGRTRRTGRTRLRGDCSSPGLLHVGHGTQRATSGGRVHADCGHRCQRTRAWRTTSRSTVGPVDAAQPGGLRGALHDVHRAQPRVGRARASTATATGATWPTGPGAAWRRSSPARPPCTQHRVPDARTTRTAGTPSAVPHFAAAHRARCTSTAPTPSSSSPTAGR